MGKIFLSIVVGFCFFNSSQAQVATSSPQTLKTQIGVTEMLRQLPGAKGEQYAQGMQHGTLQVLIYAPKEKDEQTPHDKDEVYVVVSGSGTFFDGNKKYKFKKGDVLFVPAFKEHRFETFSKDFVTWVIFYGPKGGEK